MTTPDIPAEAVEADRMARAARSLGRNLPAGANPREYWPDLTDDERDLVVANERKARERTAEAVEAAAKALCESWDGVWDTSNHLVAAQYRERARRTIAAALPHLHERWLAEVDVYRERIEALESLLVCYRMGTRPSEKLFDRLAATKAALRDVLGAGAGGEGEQEGAVEAPESAVDGRTGLGGAEPMSDALSHISTEPLP